MPDLNDESDGADDIIDIDTLLHGMHCILYINALMEVLST